MRKKHWQWVLAGGILSVMLAVMTGSIWLIRGEIWGSMPATITVSAVLYSTSFGLSLIGLMRLSQISVWNMHAQILPIWCSMSGLVVLAILIFRLPYSVVFLIINGLFGFLLLVGFSHWVTKWGVLKIGILEGVTVPEAEGLPPATSFCQLHRINTNGGATCTAPDLSKKNGGATCTDAVVALPEQMQDPAFTPLLTHCAINAVPIIPLPIFTEQITGRIDLTQTDAATLMQRHALQHYAPLKRLSDILMAMAGVIILAPMMLGICLLIGLTHKTNPLFSQKRIGLGGKEFTMYKFRTMVADADDAAPQFADRHDARITSIGRILRQTRLDETPQLFNVLMGRMSMIGPRPEQKPLVQSLSRAIPLYQFRHCIRPGITGWAQVMQGYADDIESTDTKLSYDLFYIKNLSLMMDFVIFFKTLKTIITGFGSR